MNGRLRVLVALLGVAFAVSVVHYVDNTVNYDDFPRADPGSPLPTPSVWVVGGAWFGFTAAGAIGLWAYVRERLRAAAVGLAVYSGSGLVGIAHYLVPGAFHMPWWRQTHVVADIVCGVLILTVAVRLALDPEPPAQQ